VDTGPWTIAKQSGETANECADSYFHYGKALLELARMEGGVLGNALEGVPEGDDTEDPQVESAEKMTEDVGTKVMEALEEATRKVVKISGKKSEDEMEAEVENEDLYDLQGAWEVLELAKIIYTRMIKEAKNEMNEKKLYETLLTLGEVSIENENWSNAVRNLKDCVTKIACFTYHLGVALCYDCAIQTKRK